MLESAPALPTQQRVGERMSQPVRAHTSNGRMPRKDSGNGVARGAFAEELDNCLDQDSAPAFGNSRKPPAQADGKNVPETAGGGASQAVGNPASETAASGQSAARSAKAAQKAGQVESKEPDSGPPVPEATAATLWFPVEIAARTQPAEPRAFGWDSDAANAGGEGEPAAESVCGACTGDSAKAPSTTVQPVEPAKTMAPPAAEVTFTSPIEQPAEETKPATQADAQPLVTLWTTRLPIAAAPTANAETGNHTAAAAGLGEGASPERTHAASQDSGETNPSEAAGAKQARAAGAAHGEIAFALRLVGPSQGSGAPATGTVAAAEDLPFSDVTPAGTERPATTPLGEARTEAAGRAGSGEAPGRPETPMPAAPAPAPATVRGATSESEPQGVIAPRTENKWDLRAGDREATLRQPEVAPEAGKTHGEPSAPQPEKEQLTPVSASGPRQQTEPPSESRATKESGASVPAPASQPVRRRLETAPQTAPDAAEGNPSRGNGEAKPAAGPRVENGAQRTEAAEIAPALRPGEARSESSAEVARPAGSTKPASDDTVRAQNKPDGSPEAPNARPGRAEQEAARSGNGEGRVVAQREAEPPRGPTHSATSQATPVEAPRPATPATAARPAAAGASPGPSQPAATPPADWEPSRSGRVAPLRDISLEVPAGRESGDRQPGVQVRFLERGGEVYVGVRSADQELASRLRSDLNSLADRLDSMGYRAEVWRASEPARTGYESARQDERQSPDSSGGHGQPQGGDSRKQQRNRPMWLAALEQQEGEER